MTLASTSLVTPGAVTAIVVGLGLASWNLYLTRRAGAPAARIAELEREAQRFRSELRSCRRVNRWLRARNELVAAAILRLLPESDRLDLLAAIGERVPDVDDARRWLDEDDDDGGAIV